ncbi:MAG: tRNA uridine-5-carboxymethylaminomethyl(34) synthesis GTPase MnmE [Trueperaceae bacterium]|nr:MAG: tRNA uridine-5-carboxymethylaminomethyl(34) synthesis GTPase MnmE [Trueperaceae bacterium]
MPLPPLDDTIAAIATAPGTGAIGIVRVSGPASYTVANGLFRPFSGQLPSALPGGRATYGRIEWCGAVIDEALLLSFRNPHSYTTQDLIELQTHGGPAVLRRVLELCVELGARLARPGEFTLRAFLSGRIDLVQAESVLDLVHAQSETARRNASFGLSKVLSRKIDEIQSQLTNVYAAIQAVIDYPEEEVPEAQFHQPLGEAIKTIDRLMSTAKAGMLSRRGARIALIGRPNVGKSSLLNALIGYQRSIVSDIPGTTRDYLEAPLSIEGIPVTAIDTAGIHDSEDDLEARGVAMAREIARNTDLCLCLIDGSRDVVEGDIELLQDLSEERFLVVTSKVDLPAAWHPETLGVKSLPISSVSGAGIEELKGAIRDSLIGTAGTDDLWLTNERHIEALSNTRELLENAIDAPDDLAALDLAEALQILAQITGRTDVAEETLERIFAAFCVGK